MKSCLLTFGVFVLFVACLSKSQAGDVTVAVSDHQVATSSASYESHTRVKHRKSRSGGSLGSSGSVAVEKTRTKTTSYGSNGSKTVSRTRTESKAK